MSLTEVEQVFGGIEEQGLNDLLTAFFTTRPRYLNYGSPGYVPSTNVNETQMSVIPFPGVPGGGIDWSIRMSIPIVDLHKQTLELPPELALNEGQLSVQAKLQICVGCNRKRDRDDHNDDKPHDDNDDKPPTGQAKGPCFSLKIFAIGHLERASSPDGDAVVIVIDNLELVEIEPDGFESVIECLLLQILRAMLKQVKLPLQALSAGAFPLALVRGPEIEEDQIKVYGNLV